MDEPKTEPVQEPQKEEVKSTGAGKNTMMAIVAYILFFVPLLTDSKNDPFVKFHVKQSILLVILAVINSILANVLPFVLIFITSIISLGIFVLLIIGIINAANGKQEPLPVIGKYAEQFLKF